MPSTGLLRPVESHVRVMSGGSFQINDSRNEIHLLAKCETISHSVTRVHPPGETIEQFFDDVVRPAVHNALSGQSYTFLVIGPPSSGRSQTVYGDQQKMKGLVEFTAEVLLSATEPRIVASYSAFSMQGKSIYNTPTSKEEALVPVKIQNFAAPISDVPMARMSHLKSSKQCVVLSNKAKDTTSMIQFQIYGCLDDAKFSYATLTFVELAAIDLVVPADVLQLEEAVSATVRGSSDTNFNHCSLTQVLLPCLIGSTTLVAIGTVTGRGEIATATERTLRLLSSLSQVQQVLTLVHIVSPKWLADVTQALEFRISSQKERTEMRQQEGVYDFFTQSRSVLEKIMHNKEHCLDKILEKTAAVRQPVLQQIHEEVDELEHRIGLERAEISRVQHHPKEGPLWTAISERDRLEEEINDLVADKNAKKAEMEEMLIFFRSKLAEVQSFHGKRQRERDNYIREAQAVHGRILELNEAIDTRAQKLNYAMVASQIDAEEYALNKKKSKLEDQLKIASQRSRMITEADRLQRERKSKLSRLSILGLRVTDLRQKCTSSMSPTCFLTNHHPQTGATSQSNNEKCTVSKNENSRPPIFTNKNRSGAPSFNQQNFPLILSPTPVKDMMKHRDANNMENL